MASKHCRQFQKVEKKNRERHYISGGQETETIKIKNEKNIELDLM